jgi:hypothetical protein
MRLAAAIRVLAATLTVVLAAALVVVGCGGSSTRPGGSLARKMAVVRGWSDALRLGQLDRAAAYFALPSVVQLEPGGPVATLRTRADARHFDELLPCGATLINARQVDRLINVLFLLTTRPGMQCSGTGATARTTFEIAGGKIAQWRRAADEPGDGRFAKPQSVPAPDQPAPTPQGPQAPAQSV